MSNSHPRIEGIVEAAPKIRAMKLANPSMKTREILALMTVKMSLDTINSILRNERYYDPNYTPPPKPINSPSTRGNAAMPKRLASIECPYKCPTCLMAYPMNSNKPFASQAEADRCCKRLEA